MPVGRLEEITDLRKVLSAQAVSDKQKLLWNMIDLAFLTLY